MATVKILALDGGSRALLGCFVLRRLLDAKPGLLDQVALFSGTSAGAVSCSIIATASTVREGVERAIEFWQRWHPYEGAGPLNPRTMMSISGMCAFLTHEGLYADLRALLGEIRVGEVQRGIAIPVVSLDNRVATKQHRHWSIEIVHNLAAEDEDSSPLLADLALRSSSIPILHPAFQGHVDGGLYANNPSLCALATADDFLNADLHETMILSVGQGQSNTYMALDHGDVGYAKWLLDKQNPIALIKLVMEANLQATNYQTGRILQDRFVRIDPVLSADVEPNPGVPAEEFNRQQELLAGTIDIEPTIAQLTEIGWIKAEPSPP